METTGVKLLCSDASDIYLFAGNLRVKKVDFIFAPAHPPPVDKSIPEASGVLKRVSVSVDRLVLKENPKAESRVGWVWGQMDK